MGPLDSIMRNSDRFVIQIMSPDCDTTALQISRNLFQYFSADTEIVRLDTGDQRNSNIISVGKGEDAFWINQKQQAIKVAASRSVSLDKYDGTRSVYQFEEGLGMIFLSPLSNGGLELIIWGLDDSGLRQAARLMPMLTGVGQAEFILVKKDCGWVGAGAVLAMGSFNTSWKVSEGSFIT